MLADLTSTHPEWRVMNGVLRARWALPVYAVGAAFVAEAADRADAHGHHPDLTLTFDRVEASLVSHDLGRITERDLSLASELSAIARHHGLHSRAEELARLSVSIAAAPMVDATRGFWRELLDGDGLTVTDEPRTYGAQHRSEHHRRVHVRAAHDLEPEPERVLLELWLPPEEVDRRVEQALRHGGHVLDDTSAPLHLVLADPAGVEVCLSTAVQHRPS